MRQRSRGVGRVQLWNSDGADFLAQHTLLQVCHLVASVLEKGTKRLAGLGKWECSGEECMDAWHRLMGVGGVQ